MSKNIIEKIGIAPTILAVLFLVLFAGIFASGGNSDDANKQEKDSVTLRDAHGLAVDIENPDQLYIANHSGLYGLDSTGELSAINEIEADFMSFATHPTDPNIMFSSGHPTTGGNLGLQKSDDGGKTWNKVSDGLNGPVDFHTMAVDAKNGDYIYGYYSGALQRSLDGGESWEYLNDAPDQIIQLSAGNKQGQMYAATTSGLFVSDDQGSSWRMVAFDGETVIAIEINPTSGQMIANTNLQGLMLSDDNGKTWNKSDFNTTDTVLYIASSASEPTKSYLVTKSLKIYTSSDSGKTWAQR